MLYASYSLPVQIFFYTVAFLTGGALASFIGVVVYRLPRGISFLRGRSFCPCCQRTLGAPDMIPVLSWLFLGGKCRRCRAKIPARHVITEAAGGALAVLALCRFGPGARGFAAIGFLLCLLAVTLIDLDTMEIPGGFIAALAVPALALAALAGKSEWLARAVGFLVFALPFFGVALLVKDSFGGGDIKLAAVCGLALGWKCALFALFIALLAGGGYAAMRLATKTMRRGQHFAFGPCIALGAAAALFWGDAVVRWYSSLLAF